MPGMNSALARLRPRLLLALLGVAVGGALLAHAAFYALIGGSHEAGGRWHAELLLLALAGVGWALADRRRSGIAELGFRLVPALAGVQFAVLLAIEASEGRLHLSLGQALLALLVQVLVAALVARSLPVVARILGDARELTLPARGDVHVSPAFALTFARAAWHGTRHAPRAPPARP